MNNINNIIDNVNLIATSDTITRDYRPNRYELNFNELVHSEVNIMHREAQWLINDVLNRQRPMRWLSLLGASGVGKTHLAKAIIDNIKRERPKECIQFWTWHNIVAKLRSGEWDLIQHLIDNPFVLAIDDLGATNESDITRAVINRIADARLDKWTIFTSNFMPNEVKDKIDARVMSRMYRGKNVVCRVANAGDYCYEKHTTQGHE